MNIGHAFVDNPDAVWDIPSSEAPDVHDYGHPVSGPRALELFGTEAGSLTHCVTAFIHASKEMPGKPGKEIVIKPRRGLPEVFADDFFSSLVKAPDGRWFFSGVLNGWGGYTILELARMEIVLEPAKGAKGKTKVYWEGLNLPEPVPAEDDDTPIDNEDTDENNLEIDFPPQGAGNGRATQGGERQFQIPVNDAMTRQARNKPGRRTKASGGMMPAVANLMPSLSINGTSNNGYGPTKKISKSAGIDEPYFPKGKAIMVKATMLQPKFKEYSYTKDTFGLVWYYNGENPDYSKHRFSHGAHIILATELHERENHAPLPDIELPKMTMVHHFGHRYAKAKESYFDKMTYHTALLVEWDHGEYCSIVESAWRNGIGGYKGQSNWVEDKEAKPSSTLYKVMGSHMKEPWESTQTEIRLLDIPIKNVDEFKKYLEKYSGPDNRFLDASIKQSEPVLIANRTKPDLCRYLMNRIMQNTEYSVPTVVRNKCGYNCQTFAATLFGVLTNVQIKTFSFNFTVAMRYKLFATDFETGKVITIVYDKPEDKTTKRKKSKKN